MTTFKVTRETWDKLDDDQKWHLFLSSNSYIPDGGYPVDDIAGHSVEYWKVIVSDRPIKELGLPTRVYNPLAQSGFKTIGEIFQFISLPGRYGWDNLLALRQFGRGSQECLKNVLETYLKALPEPA